MTKSIGLAAFAALVFAAALLLPSWAIFSLTLAFARGMIVLGLMMLWRAGLVSFGHALYYAIGGYTIGMGPILFGTSETVVLLCIAIVACLAVSLLLGALLARYRHIFFAMLSLAFSMIMYGVLVKNSYLGSTDGFNVAPLQLFGTVLQGSEGRVSLFVAASVLSLLFALAVHRYLQSPIGRLDYAIRDNEVRVDYLGFSVYRVIYIKYVVSAILAGIGGALTALAVGHVDPQMSYWTTSGEFVFVTILSGAGHVAAPFVGSVVFEIVRAFSLATVPHLWKAILGVCLLSVILFLPGGLWSIVRRKNAGGRA